MLLLAPMEGLLDCVLRDVLTRIGGVDRCVSEFIRVTGHLLPDRVFLRIVPELAHGCRTAAGVPVRPQLLGSDAACMADNAARLAALGAEGVDLNFGCPAKVVNRHGGGAALLREPETMAAIVAAVRRAVPARLPVSAKMRLGWDDAVLALDCALAVQEAGADELVVHARTKADGYRPPAYWEQVAPLRERLAIAVVANGEVWNVQDAQRCRAASGCAALMLGRGIVAHPGLALALRAHDAGLPGGEPLPWERLVPHLQHFWEQVCVQLEPGQHAGRLKQWLNLLRRHYPQAQQAFDTVRLLTRQQDVSDWVRRTAGEAAEVQAELGLVA